MESPCLSCENVGENKDKCLGDCERLREFREEYPCLTNHGGSRSNFRDCSLSGGSRTRTGIGNA
jgi:hypothetical protein